MAFRLEWLALPLFALGVALLAVAVLTGGARVDWFLIVPVVSGGSPVFLLGTLVLLAAFVLPVLLAFTLSADGDDRAEAPTRGTSSSGGVVLVGPVPILFGTWRTAGRSVYRRWVLVGVLATAAGLVLFLLLALFG